ncbi:MAG: LPS export ABC transporter periplasmic protein LptC [Thermoanaerobaculia bacterium]|nr:LPS export ABC transporter periplasmic protein LptC [Thermoanaerobaculia bacterium]
MVSPATIRILKFLLLGLAVVTVLGVIGLYVIGKNATFSTGPSGRHDVGTDPGTQQQGSGFDHTVSRNGKPLFRMRGGKDRRDQDGNLFIEEVLVTVYRERGDQLDVVADQARYNLEQESAVLSGNVGIAGGDGLGLRTSELILKEGGRILESEGSVEFEYGTKVPLHGTAGGLRADLERELFILTKEVEILGDSGGVQEYRLTANRVFVERGERLIRATGAVRVSWGDSLLQADKVAATLDPFEDRLQFLRAHWNVSARLVTGTAEAHRVTRARGSRIGILFEGPEGALSRIEVEDEARGRARIESTGAMGTTIQWKSKLFQAEFRGGVLSDVEAVGRAEMVEYLTQRPSFFIRRICSARSSARFDRDGDFQQINVSTDVDLQDRQYQVLADSARITPQSIDIAGTPVLVDSALGRILAPHIDFSEGNGLIHATGGVDVLLRPSPDNAITSGALMTANEPVRITAEEGFVRHSSHSFLFRGAVRAWSGQRLLRSDQLRGDAEPQRVVASGAVENVWFVDRVTSKGPGRVQIRVNAGNMIYDSEQSLVTYESNVVVAEAPRTLACDKLDVRLAADGKAESLFCTGNVRLDAPEEGRKISSDTAEYDVEREEVVFTGSPVRLTERSGGKLEGATLVYSTLEQTVRVRRREPTVDETP